MEDFKQLMQSNFLTYASYVILERAIPYLDGLKPVQRRILHTLHTMNDGKFHKVANVVGQTMAYHPHGDAAICEALVNLSNKSPLLDQQGNFGNLLTGDPHAASRYIETRLSQLALETVFNKDLTQYIPSYDGRNKEPVQFPIKIPLLLLQGAEGIAVGMSTKILPHNFVELLEAEIAILEGKDFELYPDFQTGGIMDVSHYAKGSGKIKLRALIETPNDKTLIIKEICHGTSTESLIRSIDEAAKKGKIKIESISDFTSDKVEIEITLPRGQYASHLVEALYAFTDCEVSISPQLLVIKDGTPWETDVDSVLHHHCAELKQTLKSELEIEKNRLLEKIFAKSLEQIFIENRLYKKIETISSYEQIHEVIATSLIPFHKKLLRIPSYDDRERLLHIPIRRISRFDMQKNEEEVAELENRITAIDKSLTNMKLFTIQYIKKLLKKYGGDFPRQTKIAAFEEVDVKSVATKQVKVGVDIETGFIGTTVKGNHELLCTNYDKLLLLFTDGTFQVINIPEKQYVHHNKSGIAYAGIADKKSVFSAVYKDSKTKIGYAKRFIVKQFIINKVYDFIEPGMKLEHLTTHDALSVKLTFPPKARQKVNTLIFDVSDVSIKGVSAKGIRMSPKELKSLKIMKVKSDDG